METAGTLDGSEMPVEEMTARQSARDLTRLVQKGQWIARSCGGTFEITADVLEWIAENIPLEPEYLHLHPLRMVYVAAGIPGDPSLSNVTLLLEIAHRGQDGDVLPALKKAAADCVAAGRQQLAADVADDFNWGDVSLNLDLVKAYLPDWIEAVRVLGKGDSVALVEHDEVLA